MFNYQDAKYKMLSSGERQRTAREICAALAFTVAIVIQAGCATPMHRDASEDWAAFIASVPGTLVTDDDYKTPNLKRSAHRLYTPGLDQTKASFTTWCKARGGQASSTPSLRTAGVGQAFASAASAWRNQELVLRGQNYDNASLFCFDNQLRLTSVMMVRAYLGYSNGPYDQARLPAPVVAFYTPEQAAQFADFYNQKEKERGESIRKESQQRADRRAEATRRLRTAPQIGDQTSEGVIIDLRPPLALIQYDAELRVMFGKPQSQWVPISSLSTPSGN